MENDNRKIEKLYRTFQARLRQFIAKRVPDEALADDILQEVFLKIHARIDTLKDDTKIESWIFQITRNAIIDHYRSKGATVVIDEASDIPGEDHREDAAARLALSVRQFVERLPEPYREALLLVEFERISQKALSERLGISISGAKSRVQRARGMLKDLLMQCCHFEFDRYGTILDYHPISCCCCEQEKQHGR